MNPTGACEKVAHDLVLGGGFCRVFRFPQPLTTGKSRPRRNMSEKVTIFEISSSKAVAHHLSEEDR